MEEVEECNLKIVVVSKENDIDKIISTLKNLRNRNCTIEEIIVALNKENSEEVKEYFQNVENIESEDVVNNIEFYKAINYFEYNELNEIYYDLPKELEFDYISFIEEGDTYSNGFREKILKHVSSSKHNLVVGKIINKKTKYILNEMLQKGKQVDIEKNPEKIWVHLKSAFISKELLNSIKKEEKSYRYYVEKILITKLILENCGYKIARNITLTSANKLEDSAESKIYNYDLAWYINVFEYGKEIINYSNQKYGTVVKFVQYMFMYLAKNTINENINMKNKHIIVNELIEKYYETFKQILQIIDDPIILKTSGNKRVNYYLLKLKYGKQENENIQYREYPNKIKIVNQEQLIFSAEDTKIKIVLMDFIDGKLIITGNYPFPFDENKLRIGVNYLGEKIYAAKNPLYADYRGFGEVLYQNYTFDIEIPLKPRASKEYIQFFVEGQKAEVALDINFDKPLSKLSTLKYGYWECGDFTLNYRKKSILVLKNSSKRHLKRELMFIYSLIKNKKKSVRKIGKLRILYNITKPFYKKEIWLFEDKVYKAGDNGEYLYNYTQKQKDGIKKYYILRDDCIDAQRFKKEKKKYVKFGSLKHKLLFLNADIVFTTHGNVTKQHSFDENIEKYFRGLFNSTNVCIQHGLSVQYIPHLINRVGDNFKQFYLASPVEKENMTSPEFAYGKDLSILNITGSPRYDGLKNNDQKQILITPTWRSYLALPSVKYGQSRRHNDNFKKSEYFKIYNSLINDEKLIATAKETGYKIVYLLHPCTSSQIDDFDRNEYVELIAATDDLNYEKILTESSLMVTDYSGVQFDFAYMYKPIVYFHPNELPPSYEEGAYKYETMALGEITKTNEETVDLICSYMKNNCEIKDEYKNRIDKFFKYHDYNNSKRIYEDVMKLRKIEGK